MAEYLGDSQAPWLEPPESGREPGPLGQTIPDRPDRLVWLPGARQPTTPDEAARNLLSATGAPDIRAGALALGRGELLPALGQMGAGVAQLGGLLLGPELGLEAAVPGALRLLGADVRGSIRDWHGTPHTFEPVEGNPFGEFQNENIGSGEGAQAYGWGHYIAGNPQTAETYKRASPSSALLEVHILPDEHELLDWDKPLSEQSPGVREALKQHTSNLPDNGEGWTGQMIYSNLVRQLRDKIGLTEGTREASQALHEAGIPGLKYLDAGSRHLPPGHPDATSNYVIFDPSNIRIIGRNGQRLEPIEHDPFQETR